MADTKAEQSHRTAAALAAVLALLMMVAWQALSVYALYGGDWSGLFFCGSRFGVPAALAESTYVHSDSDGYDGQFYRLVAHDPWRTRGFAAHIDHPPLRYSRGFLPVAAYFLAGGREAWIDTAYIALVDAMIAAGVYWSALLFTGWGRSTWWSLLMLLLPGTLTSIQRMVLDGPMAALMAAFLLAWERGAWVSCAVLAGLAMGVRETGAVLVIALIADGVCRRNWRDAGWAALMAIPAASWIGITCLKLKVAGQSVPVFGWPVIGHLSRLLEPWPSHAGWRPQVADVADRLAVLGLLIVLAITVRYLFLNRWRAPEWALLGFCALALILASPSFLREAFGFARPVTPLLLIMAWRGMRDGAGLQVAICFLPVLSILMPFGGDLLRIAAMLRA